MGVYSVKGKGWRYDFILQGTRYTNAWYQTKVEAKRAEAKRKEEILTPASVTEAIPTGMGFLELVNRRLDHVKAYNSTVHYRDHVSMAKRWIANWSKLSCCEITSDHLEPFILKRAKVSAYTANKEIRYLRALFNFGMRRKWIFNNPTLDIPFLPVERKLKYIPPQEDILRVIMAADPKIQDYLWAIKETLGRMGEINRLTWQDVNLEKRYVVLYTRKKRGGHLTPRKVPMTNRLFETLGRMYRNRDNDKPWVFWHRYWSRKAQKWVEGPFEGRNKIMGTLCRRAGVKYFRYHAFRHFGASTLDNANVNIGAIQRILGHENRSTTEIYLHSIGEAEREAMEVFDRISEESHTSHTQSHTQQKEGASS